MTAFLVLFAAVLSRFFPHMLHGVGLNFTALGAGLLFFGSRRPRWEAAVAVAALAVSDVVLTKLVYGMPFEVSHYLLTWAWWATLCVLAAGLLRKVTALRVAAGVLTSAIGFYVVVDFGLWAFSAMYPHTAAGLGACYVAALPFLWNDLVSTALCATVLFGFPVLAAKLVDAMQPKVESAR
jgi:hypothetical protein